MNDDMYGDWTTFPPYEEEQDIPDIINPQMDLAKKLGEDYSSDKVRLYMMLSKMPQRDKEMFVKILQKDALMSSLRSMRNLKKTSKKQWKKTIQKLLSIKGMKFGSSGGKMKIDFNMILETLLPALAFLAGTLLALKESDKKQSEAAEPENNPLLNDNFKNKEKEQLNKSIVLQYCNKKENGFSL